MSRNRRPAHEYELLPRASSESEEFPDLERHDSHTSWLGRLGYKLPGVDRLVDPSVYAHYVTPRRKKRSVLRLIYWTVFSIPYVCLFLVLFVGTFFPSYTHRPTHYNELQQRVLQSSLPGRANVHNEKVLIAASLYEENGALTGGAWGQSVLDLVDLLGPQNVHLSIYENDADQITRQSLTKLRKNATCNSTIVFEDLDLSTLPRVTLPNGDTRIKRIAFLAEVRNRALAPLNTGEVQFDKILYINDVNFNPVDAAQLLFSTNIDASGRANYGAACAVDFINAFKFYDRFATRDTDGWNMGIPFYPWFTSAGSAISRNDVLSGTDAVRVNSCWGGMTAFEAKWFQDQTPFADSSPSKPTKSAQTSPNPDIAPLRFRYEEEPFWEASECCLINADLQYRRAGRGMAPDTGIYMNPYIRVAYDTKTLSWLSLSRRPERLYSLVHDILNHIVGFPQFNPRQTEKPGQNVTDTVWEYDDPVKAFLPNATEKNHKGHWRQVSRIVNPGGFCGGRQLLVINETPEQGKGKWGKILAPRPPA